MQQFLLLVSLRMHYRSGINHFDNWFYRIQNPLKNGLIWIYLSTLSPCLVKGDIWILYRADHVNVQTIKWNHVDVWEPAARGQTTYNCWSLFQHQCVLSISKVSSRIDSQSIPSQGLWHPGSSWALYMQGAKGIAVLSFESIFNTFLKFTNQPLFVRTSSKFRH